VTRPDRRLAPPQHHNTRLALTLTRDNLTTNVVHHRVGQPTEWIKNAWRHQLMLRLLYFIAIKQGTYVRRACI
jgi:hypothetical protein